MDRSIGDRRFNITLIGMFAALALALGVVGIYGVMSYTVVQQTREVGVRLALGASQRAVLGSVLRQGGTLALIGVGFGAVGAFAVRQVLANLLYDVSAGDPWTYGTVVLALTGVALVACLMPARRAAGVDPIEALRHE